MNAPTNQQLHQGILAIAKYIGSNCTHLADVAMRQSAAQDDAEMDLAKLTAAVYRLNNVGAADRIAAMVAEIERTGSQA